MAKVTRAAIERFLSARRIAVIGASRDEKTYSGGLFAELLKHGYDAIPVNPNAGEVAGRKTYRNVAEVQPVPERALILLPEDKTEQAVLARLAAPSRRRRRLGHPGHLPRRGERHRADHRLLHVHVPPASRSRPQAPRWSDATGRGLSPMTWRRIDSAARRCRIWTAEVAALTMATAENRTPVVRLFRSRVPAKAAIGTDGRGKAR